jgi:ABC-type protease/lipase transport system fused ATPase/permease subunit
MLIRIARLFADRVGPRALDILAEAPGSNGLQSIRDLDTIRGFAAGGSASFFDLPWTPLYVALCFAFHPGLGIAVLAGAILLGLLTWAGDRFSRRPTEDIATLSTARTRLTEEMRRNALLIDTLGMRGRMKARWLHRTQDYLDRQDGAQGFASHLATATRLLRTVLQSAVLALGAWLVIHQEASGGIMLAATILTIRALSPVELAIANWRGFVAARQAWFRLDTALAGTKRRDAPTPIGLPKQGLTVAAVLACSGARRRLAGGARGDPPGRRHLRAMGPGRDRRGNRLSAAGRGAVCGDRRREHRAVCGGCAGGRGSRRGGRSGCARDDPAAPRRL